MLLYIQPTVTALHSHFQFSIVVLVVPPICTNLYWGEPERAPRLMMSTAVCVFGVVVRPTCIYTYVRTANIRLGRAVGTSGSTCTLLTVSAALDSYV